MQWEVVVGLIVLVVGVIVIFANLKEIARVLGVVSKDELCHLSVIAATKSKHVPTGIMGGGRPVTSLQCERKELVLKKKDVVVGGRIVQDKAHRLIADEMAKCWWKVGEGKADPFANVGEDVSGESYCLICSVVKFDEDLIDFIKVKKEKDPGAVGEYTVQGFMPFLMQHPAPKQRVSYYQYLFGKQVTERQLAEEVEKAKKAVVLPDAAIVYRVYKKEEQGEIQYVIGGAAILAGVVLTIVFPPAGITWFVVLAGLVGGGAYAVFDAAAYCQECEGYPSLVFVPSTQFFNEEVTFSYTDQAGKAKQERSALCNILVN